MDALAAGGSGLFAIIVLFLIVLVVLWFLLPFAVFGTKGILNDILLTQTQILDELRRMNRVEEDEQPSLRAEMKDPAP